MADKILFQTTANAVSIDGVKTQRNFVQTLRSERAGHKPRDLLLKRMVQW